MLILSHRGSITDPKSKTYPENSMKSFEKALSLGFGVELDVHRTKDGHVVIAHDASLKRLYGDDRNVTDVTLEELRKYDIPSLFEYFELFYEHVARSAKTAVQIKDCNEEEIAKLVASVFKQFDEEYPDFDIYNRAFIFDVTKAVAEELHSLEPKLQIGFSIKEEADYADYPTLHKPSDVKELPDFEVVWADEWKQGLNSKEFFDQMHELGKKVYVISPELHISTDPAHPLAQDLKEIREYWKKLAAWGADGICTDYPVELAKTLK